MKVILALLIALGIIIRACFLVALCVFIPLIGIPFVIILVFGVLVRQIYTLL